jgi:hypothetical protein
VYFLYWNGTSWVQNCKLNDSQGASGDLLGEWVYIKGNLAIAGAQYDDDPTAGADAGSASIFRFNGTTWTQEAKLTASDKAAGDRFGRSVAIDGDYAIVGAPLDDNAAGSDAGAAYVFKYDGTTWQELAKLTASDAHAGDAFGVSVSMDGNYIMGGAVHDYTAGGSDAGSAYVFKFNGTSWEQQTKLTPNDAQAGDQFGYAVSVKGDSAIISARYDDRGGGVDAGSAYIFKLNGTTWEQQAKLTPSDGAANDTFGQSVCMGTDIAMVGSAQDDTPTGVDAGSAYLYKWDGSKWVEQNHFMPSGTAAGDLFGWNVAVSGNTALVGAGCDDDPSKGADAGSVYFITLSNVSNVVSDPTNFTMHYVHDANGSADITIRATDTGGLWVEDTFHVQVDAVNDAPVLISNGTFAVHGTEDVTNPAGESVSSIIAGTISDADDPGALRGIAVTGVDNAHGAWQYSLDDGAHWTSFGTVDGSHATVLKDLSTDKIRFVPNADWNGTTVISYRA